MEKISKRKLLLAVTLFVIAIILMGSFLSISQASDWQFHYTPVQQHLKGIHFLNYNTIIEKNAINDIALLADKPHINNNNNNNKKQISGITYTAKFECGGCRRRTGCFGLAHPVSRSCGRQRSAARWRTQASCRVLPRD